ncbi:MAG: hypothetical protein MSIBF_05935 [Candidatus Altiarchaeales archaeon IMC4]|nr:MAG: hypothetical protein MSIBF_05935 [Candidatus Altiarchaeales archaeon IMC4]
MANLVKTTILLDENLRTVLINRFGQRGLSKAINELVGVSLFKPKQKSMFGSCPKLTMEIPDRHVDEHPDL